MGENRKIIIEVVARTSGAEKNLNKVGTETEKTGEKAKKASKSFLGLGKTFTAIARGFVIVKSFQLLSRAITESVKILADFELTMNKVRAITGATDKEFARLTKSAKELALGTMFTATEVGELQLAYSKLGFTTQEIIDATEATTKLATITGDDLAGAADVVGASIRGFGLDAAQATTVVNVMAKSFSSSALNLENFKQSMKTVAPIAAAANISLEQTTALLSVLADSGLRGTRAATGLKNIMTKLTDPTSDLAKELGYTINNSEGLERAFADLSKMNIDLAKATGLTDERSKAAFLTLLRGKKTVDELTESYKDSRGAADEMANIVEESVSIKFKKFFSAVENFVHREGGDFLKMLGNLVDGLTEFMNSSDPAVQAIERATSMFYDFSKGLHISYVATEDINVKIKELKDTNEKLNASFKEFKSPMEEYNELIARRLNLTGDLLPLNEIEIKRLDELQSLMQSGSSILQDSASQKIADKDATESQIDANEVLIEKLEKELKLRETLAKGDGGAAISPLESDAALGLADSYGKLNVTFDETLEKLPELAESGELVGFTFLEQAEAIGETIGYYQEHIDAISSLISSMNDLFQTLTINRLNRIVEENDFELQKFDETQQEKLRIQQINDNYALESFVGTQQEKATFERHLELERIEQEKRLAAERQALRERQLQEENDIARKGFRANKANAIAQIGMNLAQELSSIALNASGNPNNIWSFGAAGASQFAILSSIAVANSALQTAAIASQKFQPKTFQDGGTIVGASHSDGGVPFTVAGQAGFEAEGGEYIFSRSTVDRLGTGILDAINFGGASPRMFADGGAIGRATMEASTISQLSMQETLREIVGSIAEIPVVNVAQETVDTSRLVENAAAMARL